MKNKLVCAAMALSLGALTACSGDSDEPEVNADGDRVIKVGVTVPNALFMTTMVAAEAGIFADHGLDVTVEVFDGGPAATQALLAGEIDVLEGGLSEILTTYGSGNQLVAFDETVSAPAYQFFANGDAATWDDLPDGELVGVSAVGGLDYGITRYAMGEAGLNPDDFEYTAAGGGTQRASALLGGTVGLTSTSPPGNYLLEQEGLKPIGDLSEFLDTFPTEILAATEQTVEDDPELIEAMQASAEDAAEFIRQNPGETADILQGFLEYPDDQRAIYERAAKYYGPYLAPEEISREGYEIVVDFYIDEGQVKGEAADVLDTMLTFWEE